MKNTILPKAASKLSLIGLAMILSTAGSALGQQPDIIHQVTKPKKSDERGENYYGIQKSAVISLPSKSSSSYKGRTGRVIIKLQNDGRARGKSGFRLIASGSNSKFGVCFGLSDKCNKDVTEEIKNGSFVKELQGHPNNAYEKIYITIKPRKRSGRGRVRVTAQSLSNRALTDKLVVPVRIRK